MGWIHIGVHEGHGHALDALGSEHSGQRPHRAFVERQADPAMHIHAFGHGETDRPRHQRLGLLDAEIVLVVAALVGDIEDVAEALRGDQGRPCAAPFDDGIGGKRGAVDEYTDIAETLARITKDEAYPVENRLLRALRRRQQLARDPTAPLFQNHVRERAADVDGNTQIVDHLGYRPLCRGTAITVDRTTARCNLQASPPMVAP